jgi:hypothetical protein
MRLCAMLQGTFEWGIAVTMAAVVAVVGGWYAVEGLHRRQAGALPVRAVLPTAKELPQAPALPTVFSRPRTPTRTWYRFEGARGDSWLQVRAGSPKADMLFEGVLAEGSAVRFRVRSLWVRFGSTNVNLHVAGKRVRLPRMGTFDAFVNRHGVRRDLVFHPDPAQATAAQSPYSDM